MDNVLLTNTKHETWRWFTSCGKDRLDVYIHDYLLRRKLPSSANTFITEGNVATDPQMMHQKDSSFNGDLSFGTYSLQGQMGSIWRLLYLTLRVNSAFSAKTR